MTTPSDADAALIAKLDAAELRIGLCEDANLAKLLDPALPNLLNFLTSTPPVRAKLMAILSHLNKRVKGNAEIALPLRGLAELYLRPAAAPVVANFALVYLEMGFGRASADERRALLPRLLVGLAARPAAHQEQLLALLLGALPTLPLPRTAKEITAEPPSARLHPFLAAPADRALVLGWLLDVLLYLPMRTAAAPPSPGGGGANAATPPGLSVAAAKRVCGKLAADEVRGELLAAKKLAALRLLDAQADGERLFTPAEVLPHALVASCDSEGSVQSRGDSILRSLTGARESSLEALPLVKVLCTLVLGDGPAAAAAAGGGRSGDLAVAAADETRRSAASAAVRLKAVGLLCRSVAAASFFPGSLQVVFGCAFGDGTTLKLQQAGCELAHWMTTHAQLPLLAAVGAALLSGLVKVVKGEPLAALASPAHRGAPEAVAMRAFAYGAITQLSKRVPAVVAADGSLPALLFGSLGGEDAGARTSLQEALAALADVHARRPGGPPPPAAMLAALRALLLTAAASASHHSRYCAMVIE